MPRITKYSMLFKLQRSGVPMPLCVKDMAGMAQVGLPALLAGEKIIARYEDIAPAFARMRKTQEWYMQQYIPGVEIACGVMVHEKQIVPLVPIDLVPREMHNRVAWHVSEKKIHEIQEVALRAHRALRVKTHAVVRCILSKDSKVYVAAVDIAPPLTKTGLFVQSALAAGFTWNELKNLKLKIKNEKP